MQQFQDNFSRRNETLETSRRETVEFLQHRLSLLSGRDRALMEMYLQSESSVRRMSKLMKVNHGTLIRRVNTITKRLMNRQYAMCLQHRDKLTRRQLKIARDYFVRGLSIRSIAEKRNMTYHQVQRQLQTMKNISDAKKYKTTQRKY